MGRALLVALAAGAIADAYSDRLAAAVIVMSTAATVLDGVDGWIARRTATASAFGARFDMEVDALLIQILAILAWRWAKAGVWVLASGLLRYAFVAAGWLLPWIARPLPPSPRGRAICVVQIAALLVVLLPAVTPLASSIVAAAALAVLSYSFLVDTVWLWQRR